MGFEICGEGSVLRFGLGETMFEEDGEGFDGHVGLFGCWRGRSSRWLDRCGDCWDGWRGKWRGGGRKRSWLGKRRDDDRRVMG